MTVADLVTKAQRVQELAHEEREVDGDDLLHLRDLAFDLAEHVLAMLTMDRPCGWAESDLVLDARVEVGGLILETQEEVRWVARRLLDHSETIG